MGTFRGDCFDKKPWHNAPVVDLLCGGGGLRETARKLHMARTALQLKARKLSLNCHWLHRNQLARAELVGDFMLDEAIVFEEDRRLRPLSLAVLIEKPSWLIIDAFASTKPPHGSRSKATQERIDRMVAREGERRDRHTTGIAKVLRTLVWCGLPTEAPRLTLISDKEPTYRDVLMRVSRALPCAKVTHVTFKSDEYKRGLEHPLFEVDHTFALMRDRVGRFRRMSWLHSKMRKWLNRMVALYICFRNYVRPSVNRGAYTPGQLAGIPTGRLSLHQLVRWRQDWGPERSVLPTARV
mgnify:CR=1 FL=1